MLLVFPVSLRSSFLFILEGLNVRPPLIIDDHKAPDNSNLTPEFCYKMENHAFFRASVFVYSSSFSVVIMGPTLTRKWEGLPQNSCNLITRIDQTLFQHPILHDPISSAFFSKDFQESNNFNQLYMNK